MVLLAEADARRWATVDGAIIRRLHNFHPFIGGRMSSSSEGVLPLSVLAPV